MKSAALTLFLFLTSAAFPATAADGPVSGSWTVKGNVYGNDIAQVCTIKQDEKKLTGTCKSDATGEVGITGEVKDKTVTWQLDTTYNGTQITLIYSGTLDGAGSNISGKINVEPFNIEGDFTAKKDEPKKEK
jgi:type 1 fimbria pilin